MDQHTLTAFTDRIAGEVVLPDGTDYDGLRKLFNRQGSPALIVRVRNAEDVASAIRFSRANQLTLSVRSGGHGLTGLATNDGGLVIDLSYLDTVEVLDEARHLVRIGAGARWGAAAEALSAHGLAISSGDTSTVGVGGLTLGGGVGWLIRKYGLTIDSLEAAEIVTADGKTLRVSANEHPDLFWAIRGGGGNFGVVTSFDFIAHPLKSVVGGMIMYPSTEGASVAKKWAAAMRNAPEALNSTFVLFPGFGPQVPPGVFVFVCYGDDDEAAARAAIQPLLELGTVTHQQIDLKPYYKMLEEAQPPQGMKMLSESGFIKTLTDEALDAAAASYGQPGKAIFQIRYLGGAFARVDASATAFANRESEALYWATQPVPATLPQEQLDQAQRNVAAPVKAFSTGAYINFSSDPSEAGVNTAYPSATYGRLARVKAEYDPDNVFNQNHNVKPAVETPA